LIVFVDDATSRLIALHFAPAESTKAYLEVLRDQVLSNRPVITALLCRGRSW
jgi:hypothetical protein